MMVPAVVLSAHTMALGVVRALSAAGVPVAVVHYDKRDFAHHSRFVSESYTAPHPDSEPDAFLERLCNLPATWHNGVLFPVSDESLLFTAKHKEELSRIYRVACPDIHDVINVVDKQRTYPLAAKAGVPVPYTNVFKTVEELEDNRADIVLPCLVKPSQSHLYYERFGVKMRLAETWEQLREYFAQGRDAGLEVMIQEFIPGADDTVYNYNAFVVDGHPLVEFTSVHIRNAPPTFGSPRVACSEKHPDLVDVGRKLMAGLDLTGFTCTEFKLDRRDGRFKLMEVNGRHNLSTLLAVKCGINFPLIEYAYRVREELPVSRDFQPGVYWIDMVRDIAYSIRYRRLERYHAAQYIGPYRGRDKVWAIFDWRDPAPILFRICNLVANGTVTGNVNRSKHETPLEKAMPHETSV